MRLLLPDPRPDELLASVFARHQAHLGTDRWDRSLRNMFRQVRPFVFDVPENLGALGRIAGERFEPARVVAEMTLVPFYTAYRSPERRDQLLAAMMSGQGESASKMSGVGQSRLRRPTNLRFCRSCKDVDLAVAGETYWRRTHQIACVLVCPDHGEPLVETREPLVRPGSRRLADATDVIQGEPEAGPMLSDVDLKIATDLARRCRRLLEGDYGDWSRTRVAAGYAPLFAERGYRLGMRQIDAERVASEMGELFGEPLIANVADRLDAAQNNSWLRVALRPKAGVLSTTEHVLVQTFLETRAVTTVHAVTVWNGPWRCHNPHAGHDGPSIKTLESHRIAGGDPWFIARCPCGQVFTFRQTAANAPDTPVVLRNDAVGAGWREEVLRRSAQGLDLTEIASMSGLTAYWVKKIIAQGPGYMDRQASEIAERRLRWEAIIASVPDRSRALAREADPALYALLRKTDREWLDAEPRRGPKSTVGNVVNWSAVDADLLIKVITAIDELRADPMAPRITLSSIARASGVAYAWLYQSIGSGRLPLTADRITTSAESFQTYHERKLRRVAPTLVEGSERPSVARLRRAAGLEPRKYGSEAYRAMYERVLGEVDVSR